MHNALYLIDLYEFFNLSNWANHASRATMPVGFWESWGSVPPPAPLPEVEGSKLPSPPAPLPSCRVQQAGEGSGAAGTLAAIGTAMTATAGLAAELLAAPCSALPAPCSAEGSKIRTPPAPTVNAVPLGRALSLVAISVPAVTAVPPL